jgi:predicted aldo/keto reductase-like oxidoreductase
MLTFADVKRFTEAAGKPVTEADLDLLRRYRLAFDSSYCRSCRTCEGQCPVGVAVGQVSRFAMYFKCYSFEKEAMRLYAELPDERRAAACEGCPGPCATACPHGLATREMMVEAHRMLT